MALRTSSKEHEAHDNPLIKESESQSSERAQSNNEDTSLSSSELASAEQSPRTSAPMPPDNNLYTGGLGKNKKPGGFRGFFDRNRKKTIGGAVAGVLVGGGMFVFGIVQGPLQTVHFAQLLDRFHSQTNNDTFEGRLTNAWRYFRYPDSPEQRRVGKFARVSAANAETKLRNAGIVVEYERGRMHRGNITNQQAEKLLIKQGFEIKSDPKGKYIVIDPDGTSARTARERLGGIKNVAKELNIKVGYIQFRNLKTKSGIKLSQMDPRRLAQNTKEKAAKKTEFIKNLKEHITTGSKKAGTVKTKGEADKDGNQPEEPPKELGGTKEEIAKNLRRGGGALGAAGVVCVIYSTADNAAELNNVNRVMPLMRLGSTALTIGSEVQAGKVDLDELDAFNELLYDKNAKKNEQSWTNARSIQAELGQPLSGPDIKESAHPSKGGNFINDLVGGVPGILSGGLGATCSALGSVVGQAFGWAVSFAGGVGTIAFDLVLDRLLNAFQDDIVNLLAGDPLSLDDASPADIGNSANYGARLAANENAISAGGRELEDTEIAKLENYSQELEKQNYQHKNLFARIFNKYDVRSLLGSVVLSLNTNININSFTDVLTNPLSIFSSFYSTNNNVYAAEEKYDYGFNKFGFSLDELDDERFQNPYKNAEIIGPKLESYKDKINKCFGMQYDNIDGSVTPVSDAVKVVDEDRDKARCEDESEEWTRVRFYILDTMVSGSAACFEGEEEACDDLDLNSPQTSSSVSSVTSNNAQKLAQEILENNNIDISASNFCRYCTEDIKNTASGKPTYKNTLLDINILKFIADLGRQTKVDINSITGAGTGHSQGSQHYQGNAVDFSCNGISGKILDKTSEKYGIKSNFERCDAGTSHWHYSTTGT